MLRCAKIDIVAESAGVAKAQLSASAVAEPHFSKHGGCAVVAETRETGSWSTVAGVVAELAVAESQTSRR